MDSVIFHNTCRICFHSGDTLISLFENQGDLTLYETFAKKINLKIIRECGSSFICWTCYKEMNAAYGFIIKCEKSNFSIASLYHNLDKFESNIPVAKVSDPQVTENLNYKLVESRNVDVENHVKRICKQESGTENQSPLCAAKELQCVECGSSCQCIHCNLPPTYRCPFCHRVFRKKFNYKLHIKRHKGEKDWACKVCGERFVTRWLAIRHCGPRVRFSCPKLGCPKSFTSTTNLNSHIRIHNGERPFRCNECGKSFTSKNTLTEHERIHTGEKPYICPVCGMRFTTNKLSAHMATHGARTHACPSPGCGRRFKSARALVRHSPTHAPTAKRYPCPHCPALYKHTQSLNKHVKKQHT